MSYIGNPIVSTDFPVDYKSGNGSTTTFTLSIAPASVNSIDVQISGVSQSPQTYSVSGTTLTFSAAPPTGINNIVVRHLGVAGIPNVPAVGSVTPALLSTANAVYWDGSGNVGVGTTSPVDTLSLGKALDVVGTSGSSLYTGSSDSTTRAFYGAYSGAGYLGTYTNHPLVVRTNNTERMRITSGGRLLVAATTGQGDGKLYSKAVNGAYAAMSLEGDVTAGQYVVTFFNPNGFVGSIVTNGSSTAFNTSSDYRLKENVAPMQNALNTVTQLKPVTYNWKSDGSDGQGFIAHELQAVVPNAVYGEKDAVNEDGSIKPQGIDTSFLVATLTAAIQELKAELDATKAEVAALKTGA